MADFRPPQEPGSQPIDYDFLNSYYTSIMQLAKMVPDFWIDASNNNDNNDAADLTIGKIRIVAGRYKIKGSTKGQGVFSWRIDLPKGFTQIGKAKKTDLFDPIILVTPESRGKKIDDPVALMVQDVDEDGFTVIVKEVASNKQDGKALNIDFINYVAIGFI